MPANASARVLAKRRTQLGDGEDALHTVEHVLAAVSGAQIDDVDIVMDGPEPPILDGSARPFLEALVEGGVARARAELRPVHHPGLGEIDEDQVGRRSLLQPPRR